ncbi:oligosaccharide flippase family protein [Sphingomonas faeni]|uniref:oligosaccharide flippase family protein n=1 Tax=Sphingomonas faeni TaxID=185950 RepID=UPI0033567678
MSEPATDAAPPPAAVQARNTDKLLMVAATAARLAVGLLTFIILARYLGPARFGVIASAIAYTTFAAVLTDFGFAIATLRFAAADPTRSPAIIGDAIAAKAALAVPVTIVGAIVAVVVLPPEWWLVFALVHVGALANSFGELLLIATRARRRFVLEAKLVISSSVLMLLLFGGITAMTRDPVWAAAAFALTRVLYLVVIRVALRDWLEPVHAMGRSVGRLRAAMATSRGFAFDQILTVLSGQVDLLLFAAMLSAHEFGIYQAGARLAQVCVSFAPVLSTVYLPALSAAAINGDEDGFRAGSKRLTTEFAVLSLGGAAAFLFLGPIVTPLIYGPGYGGLAPLWPGLAAFVMLRFGASSFGIQLAALGHVRTRVASSLVSIALLVVLTFAFLPHYRLSVTALLLTAGAVPSIFILGVMLARDSRSSVAVRWTLPILAVVAFAVVVL